MIDRLRELHRPVELAASKRDPKPLWCRHCGSFDSPWPCTVAELLDAHDRMAGALRDAYEAMDAASKWASHQGPERDRHGDVTPEAADRHSAGFDALLDAQVRAGQALGILSGGAGLAVPKEENPR